jgi:DNA-binding MarR family transcriptional regulator
MKLDDEIKQKTFQNEHQRAILNIIYTASWVNNNMARFLKPFDLTPQQYNVLRILRGQIPKPATISLLQDRMLDKMSNASRLVDKLKTKNLVERNECPNDRRQMDVLINEKGITLMKEIDTKFTDIDKQYDTISKEEAVMLSIILDKLRG